MNIILGGTGHIGSVLAETLLARGEPVTVVTRTAEKSATWEKKGGKVAVADVRDVAALHRVFARGRRAFLLNPPARSDGHSLCRRGRNRGRRVSPRYGRLKDA
jgi:uncharacterized protein YbjT (DUF2867 family)